MPHERPDLVREPDAALVESAALGQDGDQVAQAPGGDAGWVANPATTRASPPADEAALEA
jgi:hypothetical protein